MASMGSVNVQYYYSTMTCKLALIYKVRSIRYLLTHQSTKVASFTASAYNHLSLSLPLFFFPQVKLKMEGLTSLIRLKHHKFSPESTKMENKGKQRRKTLIFQTLQIPFSL